MGRQCDECMDGYWNFPAGCLVCDCDTQGSAAGSSCNKETGQCICLSNVQGIRCDECREGNFLLGADSTKGCVPCSCDSAGTIGPAKTCDKNTGECKCKANTHGQHCDECTQGTYDLTSANEKGCTVCGCDPSGHINAATLSSDKLQCDQSTGQCLCMANRLGRMCDSCASS